MASDGLTSDHRVDIDSLSDTAYEEDQYLAHDIERNVIGPMPVDLFLNTFLPHRTRIPQLNDVKFSGIPDKPDKVSAICSLLRGGLNKVLKKSNPKLAFYDSLSWAESPSKVGFSKPELGMFREDDVNRGQLKDTRKCAKGCASGDYAYSAYMGEVFMFVEVKASDDLDFSTVSPNGDPLPGYRFTIDTSEEYPRDKTARYRVSALGQSARYAHIVQTRQFRTHLYSISVAGTTARFLRWDRSGVIVTESFDYKTSPKLLIDFIFGFSKATNEQRGFDRSANIGTNLKETQWFSNAEGGQQFADAIRRHVKQQLPELTDEEVQKEVGRHYWPGAITRLTVETDEEAREIWVSRPIFTSKGVTGRSTSGFWGVESKSKKVVFVKDIWRTNVPGVKKEGTILKGLEEAGVRYIPGLICHGDVSREDRTVQTTQTDVFARESWAKSVRSGDNRHKIVSRIHYQLVTNIAGFRLSTFKGSKELLSATFDVFTAVMDAHLKASTIHRDIAIGNIILYRSPDQPIRLGYLIDWELSCKIDRVDTRDHILMGTPAFMSINVIFHHPHVHRLEDDLESILYVVLYCALRWLLISSPSIELDWWMANFFSASVGDKGGGATNKLGNAIYRSFTNDLTTSRSQAVVDWLTAAMNLHYHNPNPDCVVNPAWKDGKALETMWEGILRREIPNDDRQENPLRNIKLRERYSLHATYTLNTAQTILFDSRGGTPPLQFHSATAMTTTSKETTRKSDADDGMFNQSLKRRRIDREGGNSDMERSGVPLPEVLAVESDSPDTSPTRGGKLRRTDFRVATPPSLVAGPSQQQPQPPPRERRATRSSTRRIAGRDRAASTAAPTSKPIATPAARSTRSSNAR